MTRKRAYSAAICALALALLPVAVSLVAILGVLLLMSSGNSFSGPTLLALTRQAVPNLNEIPPHIRRAGVLKGGYVALQETAPLTHILIATGSELALALAAAKTLGAGVRVVSMPCTSRFDRQSAEYREAILPSACRKRVAVEAGVTSFWSKYVGLDGKVVGIDRFGISAPAPIVFKELGITAEAIVAAAQSL